jgi:hypothetical protein
MSLILITSFANRKTSESDLQPRAGRLRGILLSPPQNLNLSGIGCRV